MHHHHAASRMGERSAFTHVTVLSMAMHESIQSCCILIHLIHTLLMACVLRWQVTITRLNHHFTGRKRQRGALGTGASIAPPCAHVLPSSPRIRALPCSTHACPSIARLARPALLRGCGAHAVCVCCAQARGALQAHVQGGGLGVWDAAREGWAGQCKCWAYVNVAVAGVSC